MRRARLRDGARRGAQGDAHERARRAAGDAARPIVRIRDLVKEYRRGAEVVRVLDGLSLDIAQGDFVALMGPSGSGKSTLLNLIGGLDRPTSGSLEVEGLRVDQLTDASLARWRADHVGLRVPDVQPAARADGRAQRRAAAAADEPRIASSACDASPRRSQLVGLSDRAKHRPRELSGGQEQRVGIARAIVTDPTLLLCDEPTGDLDRKSGDEVLTLLEALNDEYGKTIVMVTHDPHAAERAHRVIHLDKGTAERRARDDRHRQVPAAARRRACAASACARSSRSPRSWSRSCCSGSPSRCASRCSPASRWPAPTGC